MNISKINLLSFLSIILFSSLVFAHPHHEGEFLASLGLDHIFYALLVTLAAFFVYGRISK